MQIGQCPDQVTEGGVTTQPEGKLRLEQPPLRSPCCGTWRSRLDVGQPRVPTSSAPGLLGLHPGATLVAMASAPLPSPSSSVASSSPTLGPHLPGPALPVSSRQDAGGEITSGKHCSPSGLPVNINKDNNNRALLGSYWEQPCDKGTAREPQDHWQLLGVVSTLRLAWPWCCSGQWPGLSRPPQPQSPECRSPASVLCGWEPSFLRRPNLDVYF